MDNQLYHYGVLGMKWGRRKNRRAVYDSADSARSKEIRKKNVSEMSNQELRDVNNRLQLEKQYKDLTMNTSRGKQAVNTFIRTAGTLTAIATAAKAYEKFGRDIIGKIGGATVADIKG